MGLLDAFKQYVRDAMPGGLLNAEWTPERVKTAQGALLDFTPVVGEVRSGMDAYESAKQGDWPLAALGAVGALPILGTMARGVKAGKSVPKMFGQSGQIVWHGSPHKFSKFDMSKIGTGEGAQAYGHGLYFAEAKDVAETYSPVVGAKYVTKSGTDFKPQSGYEDAMLNLVSQYGDAATALQKIGPNAPKEIKVALQRMIQEGVSVQPASRANLYKIDIPDEAVARFLDWDKPLSQQAPEVLEALKKTSAKYGPVRGNASIYSDAAAPYMTGHDFYRDLANALSDGGVRRGSTALSGQDAIASQHLKELGIPGIRYLDGGSRSAGSGSSNFVLFDDAMARILETNGSPTGLAHWKPNEFGLLNP